MATPSKKYRERIIDPTDREIIRVLKPLKLKASPNKIAKAISVRPQTVQERLIKLDKLKITECDRSGKHKMVKCKLNKDWKKNLEKVKSS